MKDDVVIEFKNLEKRLGKQQVLRGVSLQIHRAERLVVIGRSGCGKSVLLKHLIGLMQPDKGQILVDGKNVVSLNEMQMVPIRKKIGIVFQGGALFDSLSVEANVGFPLKEEKKFTPKEIKERVAEVLEAVGLPNQERKMPSELSGGMKKRVALARAIARLPEVILYDEPTTGLDPITADSINQLINQISERYGVTSVVVTHDMKSVFAIADRIAMLRDGVIYKIDTPENFQKSKDEAIQHFIEGVSDTSEVMI
ncbi:MAG: ABC transporter ATP-binding protein [Verrucomicrobiia bacterium]